MVKGHSYHIRESRWALIKEHAWKLSSEKGEIIKPTDIIDAAIAKGISDLSIEDVEEAKKSR